MARRHRKASVKYWQDPQKVTDYFAKLAKQCGRPSRRKKIRLSPSEIPAGSFISHSYQDRDDLQRLLALLPSNFSPKIFPPIRVLPTEFVSTPLVEAVRASPALVYLAERHSSTSPWVAIERDIALRAGKPVFAFHASRGEFAQDHAKPAPFMIHAIYALEDRSIAEAVIGWMEVNRNFRVEKFSPFEYTDMGELAGDINDFGGTFLAFIRKETIRDLPMQFARLACEQDDDGWISIEQRMMLACLDPPGPWIPNWIEQYVVTDGKIDLTNDGNTRPWSANRVDDLVVRLIYKWAQPFTASPG